MNRSSALDLKSPLERGGPLAVGCVLFEARLTSIRLAEFYRMYNSSRDWSVCAICSCQEPTTALSGLFQGSGFSSPQRPTPSATSWPSPLKLIITHKSARKSVCIFKDYEQLYETLPDGLYPWISIALSSNEAANSSQHVDYLVYCRWFIWQRFVFVCHLVQDLPFIFIEKEQ